MRPMQHTRRTMVSERIAEMNGPNEIILTEYWGGLKKGKSVQIMGRNSDGNIGCVGMTRDEVGYVVDALRAYLTVLKNEESEAQEDDGAEG